MGDCDRLRPYDGIIDPSKSEPKQLERRLAFRARGRALTAHRVLAECARPPRSPSPIPEFHDQAPHSLRHQADRKTAHWKLFRHDAALD
jgi:hypothetical protein